MRPFGEVQPARMLVKTIVNISHIELQLVMLDHTCTFDADALRQRT